MPDLSGSIKIRFQVEDTGSGIEENKLNDIFSPFKQAGRHTRSIEGTGLGLAISKKLVGLMGSELYVKSKPGQGSTFWFDLDLFPAVSCKTDVLHEEPRIIGYLPSSPAFKILIVDDKWENRTVLMSLLMPLGFEIIEAADGQECLNKVLEFKPDIVLLDLIMPVMDGFEASRCIKKNPECKHIKIITISASTLVSPDQIIMETGCDDYIAKPVKIQEVLDKLSLHLGFRWKYKEKDKSHKIIQDNISCTDQCIDEKQITAPGLSDLAMLYEYAMDGDFKRLNEKMDAIVQADRKYSGFVNKLNELAKTLDEDAICRFIIQYQEDADGS